MPLVSGSLSGMSENEAQGKASTTGTEGVTDASTRTNSTTREPAGSSF